MAQAHPSEHGYEINLSTICCWEILGNIYLLFVSITVGNTPSVRLPIINDQPTPAGHYMAMYGTSITWSKK